MHVALEKTGTLRVEGGEGSKGKNVFKSFKLNYIGKSTKLRVLNPEQRKYSVTITNPILESTQTVFVALRLGGPLGTLPSIVAP